MLTDEEIKGIRKELDESANPLFIFHDDPDGLCSFLLFYRYKKEGHGITVKKTPKIDETFLRKVEEYQPDKIFILDIATVEQEFIDKAKTPIVWIDHHEPLKRDRVKYYNPRNKGDAEPVSSICYKVVEKDLWIAAVGCIADCHMPDFIKEFSSSYPKLLDSKVKNAGEALFASQLGKLCRIFSFALMGSMKEVMAGIKTLTRITSPEEILEQKTTSGKFIYKRYEKIQKKYDELMQRAEKSKKGKLLLFLYTDADMSLTKDLSNELIYKNPDKTVIVGREKNDEIKMSIRANKRIDKALEKALIGIEGYGGGHEQACGAVVKKEDFERFIENLKEQL